VMNNNVTIAAKNGAPYMLTGFSSFR